MSESAPKSQAGSTDIAALSAGVVAVVVSLFVTPGSFGIVNLVVSFTLMAIVAGYVWPHVRRRLQSLAVAATVGLASIPAVGFVDETVRSRSPLEFLVGMYEWNCESDPCSEGKDRSRVPDRELVVGWFVFLLVTYSLDRLHQNRMRKADKVIHKALRAPTHNFQRHR